MEATRLPHQRITTEDLTPETDCSMIQELPQTWKSTLEALGLETEQQAEPAGESNSWYQFAMRFTTRGFMLVYIRPQAERLMWRLECALPAPERADTFIKGMLAALEPMSAHNAHLITTGPPLIFSAEFELDIEQDQQRALGMLMLKIGDYLQAAEDNATASLPFAQQEAAPPAPASESSATAPATSSAFESIGSKPPEGSTTHPEAQPQPQQAKTSPVSSVFESIGTGEAAPTPEGQGFAPRTCLARYELRPQQDTISLWIKLDHPLERHEHATLEQGLIKSLRIRFDVDPRPEFTRELDELAMSLVPIMSTDTASMRAIEEGLDRMFSRLVEFGRLGMDLFSALDLRAGQAKQRPETDFSERSTLVDVPSKRDLSTLKRPAIDQPHTSPQQEPSGAGVVLDLGPQRTTSSQDDGPLKAGNFSDPRLKRSDATAPLVDVVLRHPGFSDKRIGQVLNILLSIEHSKALQLIEAAPCVIAWGISRERALTFKNVIEGAGGKALLVEPDTFEGG